VPGAPGGEGLSPGFLARRKFLGLSGRAIPADGQGQTECPQKRLRSPLGVTRAFRLLPPYPDAAVSLVRVCGESLEAFHGYPRGCRVVGGRPDPAGQGTQDKAGPAEGGRGSRRLDLTCAGGWEGHRLDREGAWRRRWDGPSSAAGDGRQERGVASARPPPRCRGRPGRLVEGVSAAFPISTWRTIARHPRRCNGRPRPAP
jgi:hypothetical protein